jgi:hypothetical protein
MDGFRYCPWFQAPAEGLGAPVDKGRLLCWLPPLQHALNFPLPHFPHRVDPLSAYLHPPQCCAWHPSSPTHVTSYCPLLLLLFTCCGLYYIYISCCHKGMGSQRQDEVSIISVFMAPSTCSLTQRTSTSLQGRYQALSWLLLAPFQGLSTTCRCLASG